MKSNENQNTFEALPVEVRNSALTTKQMGVLNVLYRMSTMETSKANPDGSFFAAQSKLMEETGYAKNTIIDVRSNFDECGFITTQKGTWEGRMATTYILHKDIVMEWAKSHPRIGAVKQRRAKKGSVIGSVNKCPDAVNKCPDEETQTLRDEVKQLREVVTLQNQRISALEEVINEMRNGSVIGSVNDNSLGSVIGSVMDKCPTEPELKKESTNHSVTSSNSSMGLPICAREENDTDEGTPSNGGDDQTGSVCDFQNKIEGGVDTSQPDETTPSDEQTTINHLNELAMTLRDSNTNLNHDEVMKLAGELSEILTKQGNDYYSAISKTASECVGLIATFQCDNLTTLAELTDVVKDNLNQINGKPTLIALHLGQRKAQLTKQAPETAQISTIDTADKETSTDEEKTRQKRNKVANPVSGNADLNPQNEKTSQTSENKASGSVATPQMGKLSTDNEKSARTSADEAREAFWNGITAEDDEVFGKQVASADRKIKADNKQAACKVVRIMIDTIDNLPTLGTLKFAKVEVERICKEIGDESTVYLTVALNHIANRRDQLLAA